MLMKYDEVMTRGTPLVEKNRLLLSVHFFLCDVFLVTHVGELTHLGPLYTQMSKVGKH